jgi:hypothetical protein
MIGKAKSNKSLSATIAYNNKNSSSLFFTNNLIGNDKNELLIQMEDLQKCYTGKGKNLTIHAQLSPAIEDGKKLTTPDWEIMANKFLEKMQLSNFQAIGYLHEDKEHMHCHLVNSRPSKRLKALLFL